MKNKEIKNISGIKINDSIVMSVKNRRRNLRTFESLIIAICGYISFIMFFLTSFQLEYNSKTIYFSILIFAILYGTAASFSKKLIWIFPVALTALIFFILNNVGNLKNGFKLIANEIYKVLNTTSVNYFKGVSPIHAERNITLFVICAICIVGFIIFFFTICKPNILIIVITTFPLIEVLFFYGVKVPPIWTSLLVAYWLALLSVCGSDLGEYYGGGGGFTRKDNLFFPKRKMKFKVTEKCGIILIFMIVSSALLTLAVMKISGYERSDKIKQQRKELKSAINSFSMEDVASSISNITNTLGLSFEYQDNRLGQFNKIKYKNKTELIITVSDKPDTAIYLKGFNASDYHDNEWFELDDKKYSEINEMFEEYNISPQEFIYNIQSVLHSDNKEIKIKINSQKKKNKFYTPYGIIGSDDITFVDDNIAVLENPKSYSVSFITSDFNNIFPYYQQLSPLDLFYLDLNFSQNEIKNIKKFEEEYDSDDFTTIVPYLILNPDIQYNSVMSMLIENEYRKFVYQNYLNYPDTNEMREVYDEYSDIFENADISTATSRINILQKLKDRINETTIYSLEPGRTPSTRDFVNYFLLENHKGYCTHYATSGVILARMAGIPARYATGYISVLDDFTSDSQNPDGSYTIKLPDNRSHAWTEVYIDGYGWIPFEFTSGYSNTSITTETTTALTSSTSETTNTTTITSQINNNTSDSKSSSKKTSSSSVSTSHTTTEITKNSGVKKLSNNKNTDDISNIVKIACFIISIISLIVLRRIIILKIRFKQLNSNNYSERVTNNYQYIIKLLNYLDISQENQPYNEFAESIDNMLSEKYFKKGDFIKFNEIILKYTFGNISPVSDEVEFISDFSLKFASNIYKEANTLKRLYIKYICVII